MWKRLVVILVPITALLALLAYGFRTNPREISSPLLGRAAAPFSLELFDGARFSLADAKGKVVVVNFWASWCVPCREEAPLLEATWRAYRDRGVVLVGVNFQDDERSARDLHISAGAGTDCFRYSAGLQGREQLPSSCRRQSCSARRSADGFELLQSRRSDHSIGFQSLWQCWAKHHTVGRVLSTRSSRVEEVQFAA